MDMVVGEKNGRSLVEQELWRLVGVPPHPRGNLGGLLVDNLLGINGIAFQLDRNRGGPSGLRGQRGGTRPRLWGLHWRLGRRLGGSQRQRLQPPARISAPRPSRPESRRPLGRFDRHPKRRLRLRGVRGPRRHLPKPPMPSPSRQLQPWTRAIQWTQAAPQENSKSGASMTTGQPVCGRMASGGWTPWLGGRRTSWLDQRQRSPEALFDMDQLPTDSGPRRSTRLSSRTASWCGAILFVVVQASSMFFDAVLAENHGDAGYKSFTRTHATTRSKGNTALVAHVFHHLLRPRGAYHAEVPNKLTISPPLWCAPQGVELVGVDHLSADAAHRGVAWWHMVSPWPPSTPLGLGATFNSSAKARLTAVSRMPCQTRACRCWSSRAQ